MEWVWFLTGLIVALVLCGGIWVFVRWYLKRPTWKTKQGLSVCTHDNPESRKLSKRALESFLSLYVTHLISLGVFSEKELLGALDHLVLIWKPMPFWNSSYGWVSGIHSGNVIQVGFLPRLTRTALAHELMHEFLEEIKKTPDESHKLKEYWKIADSFWPILE